MKLYEILNENYLGRKFKLIQDGIESEFLRVVAKNSKDKYGYVMDHNCIWNLSEGNLLCEVEFVETDEDKYDKLTKNNFAVKGYKNILGVNSNYDDYYDFLKNDDCIFISINNGSRIACIDITFEDFDKISVYIEKLRELKQNKK